MTAPSVDPSMNTLERVASNTWTARVQVAAIAAATFWFGVAKGTFAASDTDPYGYVSQGELIASGALRIDLRYAWDLPWPAADMSLVPPGYTMSEPRGFAVPTYASGLPLVMAALQRLTGRRDAAFYVVPLLGALAVWMTAWLGTRLNGAATGVAAAALLATSPVFMQQLTQPVSDVPAAAWWITSLALVIAGGSPATVVAGLAAAMAVLTRPNLVPIAALIAAYLAWECLRPLWPKTGTRRQALARLLLFAAGVIPGCLAVAAINKALFGSPFESGYGSLGELYEWAPVLPNLIRYPEWLLQTESPLIFFALAAPLLVRSALSTSQLPARSKRDQFRPTLLALACALFVLSAYLPWGVFEEWVYLRFLLPAFPLLFISSLMVLGVLVERLFTLRRRRHVAGQGQVTDATPQRVVVMVVVLMMTAAWLWWHLQAFSTLVPVSARDNERRYLDVSHYVAVAMSPQSAFIAGLHSGSLHYHAGRMTLNYRRMQEGTLDAAVAGLTKQGYKPYILLEEGEEPHFRARFSQYDQLGALDWPPTLHTSEGVPVHIFDPSDREPFLRGAPIGTVDMLFRAKPKVTVRGQGDTAKPR